MFEDYLSTIENEEKQQRMAAILAFVSETFPALEGKIAWNHPHFSVHGTFIIGFSYAKNHIAVAPEAVTINKFTSDALSRSYEVTKQLIKIKDTQTIDYDLLKNMIAFNIKDKKDITKYWR
mgnify:CR=1 FL=1